MEALPSGSTYWVAICPFSFSRRITSASARNRPSPWLIGTVTISPTRLRLSQGLRQLATRVRTSRLWCLPMVLKVSVGACSSGSVIRPKGTRPSLISAWNPLQIPPIRPSRFSSSSVTASATA